MTAGPDPDWLRRPEGQFHDLPLDVRWEASRRHPTYLLAWRPALTYHRGGPFSDGNHALLCQAASMLLTGIGVAGEPIDPATSSDRLLDGVGPEWLGGPVRPISLRAMATILYTLLPAAERLAIGEALVRSASREHAVPGDDAAGRRQIVRGIGELQRLPFPSLDRIVADKPLYYVHMDVSQRSILDDMTRLIRRHHAAAGREDRRTRTDAVADDLAVWDRREGWTGAGYETAEEESLQQVGRELDVPPTTAAARYKAAFRLVTGLDFTPERWWRLMGPLKFAATGEAALGVHAEGVRRQLSGRADRPVPESTLQGGRPDDGERPGLVTGGAAAGDAAGWLDLRLDLENLIDRGKSDAEIAAELEIPAEAVAAFRVRRDEFRSL